MAIKFKEPRMEDHNVSPDILNTIQHEIDDDIHPFLKLILDNLKPIALAVGGIVLVVGIYSGVTAYQEAQYAKSVSTLGTILVEQDMNARIKKLEDFAATAPKELQTGIHLELARLYTASGEPTKADEAWKNIGQQEGMGTISALARANSLIRESNYAAAVEILADAKKNAAEEYAAIISSTLAFAAEQAGQKDVALAEYEFLKSKGQGSDAFLDYKISLLKAAS